MNSINPIVVIAFGAGLLTGALLQHHGDRAAIARAQQNEAQANGLEDECKAELEHSRIGTSVELSDGIHGVFTEKPNGDWRLSMRGGRRMVCEEKDVKILRQPDAVQPLVVGCSHP